MWHGVSTVDCFEARIYRFLVIFVIDACIFRVPPIINICFGFYVKLLLPNVKDLTFNYNISVLSARIFRHTAFPFSLTCTQTHTLTLSVYISFYVFFTSEVK